MNKLENNEIVFIDPLSDFGFKKIFSEEPNKELLISFLNEVFRGRKVIEELVYNKNEHLGDNGNEGGAIFDLLCTGKEDENFIIEVQRARQSNFKKRALFYTSRLISNQPPKGNRAKWNYDIKEVYLIAILEGFSLEAINEKIELPQARSLLIDNKAELVKMRFHSQAQFSMRKVDNLEYLSDICLINRDTSEIFYEGLGFIYIELSKFAKTESELETDLDRWLYVLKNMSLMKKIPTYLRKPIFEKLFNIAEYSNLSKEEKTMYDSKQKARWDNYSIMETAKREGKREEKLAIALEFKKMGIPIEDIAKGTGLPIEEIEKL